jgi:hypothetical protein
VGQSRAAALAIVGIIGCRRHDVVRGTPEVTDADSVGFNDVKYAKSQSHYYDPGDDCSTESDEPSAVEVAIDDRTNLSLAIGDDGEAIVHGQLIVTFKNNESRAACVSFFDDLSLRLHDTMSWRWLHVPSTAGCAWLNFAGVAGKKLRIAPHGAKTWWMMEDAFPHGKGSAIPRAPPAGDYEAVFSIFPASWNGPFIRPEERLKEDFYLHDWAQECSRLIDDPTRWVGAVSSPPKMIHLK